MSKTAIIVIVVAAVILIPLIWMLTMSGGMMGGSGFCPM